MFYYMETNEIWDTIMCILVAHVIMWMLKTAVKAVKKLHKWNKQRKEEKMMAQVRAMMEQSKTIK